MDFMAANEPVGFSGWVFKWNGKFQKRFVQVAQRNINKKQENKTA